MDAGAKLSRLLQRADDTRRLAMDELDDIARRTGTFGSKEHRDGRDRVERTFAQETQRFQSLPEEELDRELLKSASALDSGA
jgi:isopenicillin N synthase-like dioxygenase